MDEQVPENNRDEAPDRRRSASVDVEAFARNLARMIEQGGKALAAYMKPREEGEGQDRPGRRISPRSSGPSARSRNTGCPTRSARSNCRRGSASPISTSGATRSNGWPANGAAGCRARPARQALHRSGMVDEPVLRLPQAGLSAHRALGRPAGRGRRRISIRIPGRRRSSISGRSPTRFRRRISC